MSNLPSRRAREALTAAVEMPMALAAALSDPASDTFRKMKILCRLSMAIPDAKPHDY
jgi:hypothetical protein